MRCKRKERITKVSVDVDLFPHSAGFGFIAFAGVPGIILVGIFLEFLFVLCITNDQENDQRNSGNAYYDNDGPVHSVIYGKPG